MLRQSIYKRILPVVAVISIVDGFGIPVIISRAIARELADSVVISLGPPIPLKVSLWFDLGGVAVIPDGA